MILNKLYALISTAMPGIHKVTILTILALQLNEKDHGQFASDFFLIQALMILTSIGVSNLLLVRFSAANKEEKAWLLSKALNSTLILSVLIIPVLFILYELNVIFDLIGTIYLLITWSVFIVVRHALLSEKAYIKIIIYESLFMVTPLFFYIYADNALSIIATGYSIVSFSILYALRHRIKIFCFFDRQDLKKSIDISLANFFSGSVIFLLVPVVSYVEGPVFSSFIALLVSYLSMMLLFPRSMSYFYLPDMSKNKGNRDNLFGIMKKFEKYNHLTLILLFCVAIFIYWSFAVLVDSRFLGVDYVLSFCLILIGLLISQLALPSSNILFVFEKTKDIFLVNAIGFIIFGVFTAMYLSLNNYISLSFFLSVIIIINIYKLIKIKEMAVDVKNECY
jgi:O-antigen/teichoic acid export membrane protein